MSEVAIPAFILLAVGGVQAADFPPHPRLLFNSEGIVRLRQKIESCGWAQTAWKSLKSRADGLLEKKVELPPRGGNWSHWYACPTHGERLNCGRRIDSWRWEHVCPVDGEIFKGDPNNPSRDYDGCVMGSEHYSWATATRDLGVVYQITGDTRYADKAREILLAYSKAYPTYPLHTVHGERKIGGGRMGAQSLDESVRLIPFCQGADLVWDRLSDEERNRIARDFILPAVKEVILPHKMDIHNIQCWKNSAVGLAGFLLGDTDLVDAAVSDPDRGYRAQVARGVTADGGWWEGAWGYHFYTMSAIWPLTEAARNCGLDLYGPEFRRMFEAPLKFAAPDLRLPAFSDSGEVDLNKSSGIYELGYARYRDPAFLPIIAASDRTSDYAFWFGEPELPAATKKERSSANYPASGYAVLTRGDGEDAVWLCFKYGPYGGGHGHPDKLSFVLYSGGRMVAVDPGSVQYGLPIHAGWFRTSIAHNTLSVDEMSQKPVDGRLIAFGSSNGVDYVAADAGDIYEGVRFVRTIALLDKGLIAVVDQVKADKPRTLDIAYHQIGVWADLPPGEPWSPPDKPGYSYLKDCSIRKLAGPANLSTRLADGAVIGIAVGAGGEADLITGTGVTSGTQERVPCAIIRHTGTHLSAAWAITLDGRPAGIKPIVGSEDRTGGIPAAVFRVTSADGKSWLLCGGAETPVK